MRFHVRREGRSGRRYLHIHGNEDTARQVLNLLMKTHSGIAYLIDSQDRYVTIHGAKIDPNRLFSRVGAEKSLQDQNPAIARDRLDVVLDFLDRHREGLVRHLEPHEGDLLFALHNNRDYSVKEEIEQSDETSIVQPDHPREFFLCTDPRDFAMLRQSPYNVVLQNRKPTKMTGRSPGCRRSAGIPLCKPGMRHRSIGRPAGEGAVGRGSPAAPVLRGDFLPVLNAYSAAPGLRRDGPAIDPRRRRENIGARSSVRAFGVVLEGVQYGRDHVPVSLLQGNSANAATRAVGQVLASRCALRGPGRRAGCFRTDFS